jgi:predicted phage gp36 major capsid-like protein
MSELDQTEMIETSGDSPVITSAGAAGDDVANAFDDFMRAFESFKAENEQRIAKIEKRLPVDVLTTEKLDRINRAIDEHKSIVDELALKSARPKLGASGVYRSGAALSTKPHSRPMSAMARPTVCISSKRRRSRSAQVPTAAISCPPRPRPR